MSSKPWYIRMLGPNLSKRNHSIKGKVEAFPTETILNTSDDHLEVVGLYFTPVFDFEEECTITSKLIEFYKQKNFFCRLTHEKTKPNENSEVPFQKRFEIIQVPFILGSGNEVSRKEAEYFTNQIQNVPWFTVPFKEKKRKKAICCLFNASLYGNDLVLLHAKTGSILTTSAIDHLKMDPRGERFPWKTRPLLEILRDGHLLSDLETECLSLPRSGYIGIYFSAEWCGPCHSFTKKLTETYTKVRERGQDFEIIFVSWDSSEDSFANCFSEMPWIAVPYAHESKRQELNAFFRVEDIPSLVIIDTNGRIVEADAHEKVTKDPEGMRFPWNSSVIEHLTPSNFYKLYDEPAVIYIFGIDRDRVFAEGLFLGAAEEYRQQHHENDNVPFVHFFTLNNINFIEFLWKSCDMPTSLPLLAAIDIPRGLIAVTDLEEHVTKESVKLFVQSFLEGTADMKPIV